MVFGLTRSEYNAMISKPASDWKLLSHDPARKKGELHES